MINIPALTRARVDAINARSNARPEETVPLPDPASSQEMMELIAYEFSRQVPKTAKPPPKHILDQLNAFFEPGAVDSRKAFLDVRDEDKSDSIRGLLEFMYYMRASGPYEGPEGNLRIAVPWYFPYLEDAPENAWIAEASWSSLDKTAKKAARAARISYADDDKAGSIVYEWPGEPGERWWVARIPDADALKTDGTVMGHCTRDPKHGHQKDLTAGRAVFYSLRHEMGDGDAAERVYTLKSARKLYDTAGKKGFEVRGRDNRIPGFKQRGESEAGRMTSDDEAAMKMLEFMADEDISIPSEIVPFIKTYLDEHNWPPAMTERMISRAFYQQQSTYALLQSIYEMLDESGSRPRDTGISRTRRNPRTTPRDILAEAARLMAVPAFSRT